MRASYELQCTTQPSSVGAIHDFIDRCFMFLDPEHVWLPEVHVIADEMASNIEKYAYGRGCGTYSVRVTLDNTSLELQFEDAGKAFNPIDAKELPIDGDHNRPAGNLGILLVMKLADRIRYSRREGLNVTSVVICVPNTKLLEEEQQCH